MKLFKKTFSLLAVVALCLGFFFSNSVTASAAEPVTWYLKYVNANNEWRFQKGSWEENGFHRELYYMYQEIKDGDTVVIDSTQGIELNVNVHLKNLTVANANIAIVTAQGYDEVYILNNTVAAINGDIKEAYVYDNCSVNFNNNVGSLRMLSDRNEFSNSSVNALGTVDYLYGKGKNYVAYEFYSFQANTLKIVDGIPYTQEGTFSTTPPATTTTPSTPATNNNSNNANDYDDVPKTGDNGLMNPLWLVAIAAICAFGAYKLNK